MAADHSANAAAAPFAALPAFQGSDEWVRAQLERKAAKAKHRELRNADTTIVVPFNREEFTQRVQVRHAIFVPALHRYVDVVSGSGVEFADSVCVLLSICAI